jgi:hypothetical protein
MEEEMKEQEQKEQDPQDSEKQEVFPAEEQGIEAEKTSEEVSDEMDIGEKDEDVYSKEGQENLVEDGEISPEEEGFMRGETDEGQLAKDALTGEPLMDVEDVVEAEIKGKLYRFVNQENAEEFRKKLESEDLE